MNLDSGRLALVAGALTVALTACSDPTREMSFKASIEERGSGQLELITEVSNFSAEPKTLNDLDIDQRLHNALQLETADGVRGSFTPIDNTISYTINKVIAPQERFQFRLFGIQSEEFVSGDVDFIINNDYFNYRSIALSCCMEKSNTRKSIKNHQSTRKREQLK